MKTKEIKPTYKNEAEVKRALVELKIKKVEYVKAKLEKQNEVAIIKKVLNQLARDNKNCEVEKAERTKLRRELVDIEDHINQINLHIAAKKKQLNPESNLLKQIKILKDNYRSFSQDERCIPNLRAMASEVSKELEEIIKHV